MISAISSPLQNIGDRYDVVVVGSGYGGGIAASRLARAGRRVCVLERGREIRPGEYPDTQLEAALEFQLDAPAGHIGSHVGMFDFHANQDMHVLVGCGLGGTSLINANVYMRPEPRVLQAPEWPEAFRADVEGGLEQGYRRAEAMLTPGAFPADWPRLLKLEALERSAAHLGAPFARTPINVRYEDGPNPVGVQQSACMLCGDCVSGCNYAAKSTTLMNYLPDAYAHGADIFTQAAVRSLERSDDGWLVHYQPMQAGRERFHAPELFVRAGVVVLGAGTLGSTEILLRSRDRGLPLSSAVGSRFSGNGDLIGFAYNGEQPVNAVGFGSQSPAGREPVGPCITGVIDLREQPELDQGLIVQEGVIPGALAGALPEAFALAARTAGVDVTPGAASPVETQHELDSLVNGPYSGSVNHSQIYLVMAHDDAGGRIVLDDDRSRVVWPGVGEQARWARLDDVMRRAAEANGGRYIRNPVWSGLLGHDLVTVHPLGGCPMGEDASTGAVNHRGQVFTGEGDAVYDSLLVCDGSVVPRSLGINPSFTISAVAERSVALLTSERGWTEPAEPPAPRAAPPARKPGVRFTERMHGHVSTLPIDDYAEGAAQGEANGSSFEFTLTIASQDLDGLLGDDRHAAQIVGSVVAPHLSRDPIAVTKGEFNLLAPDPERGRGREMRYRMHLSTEEGRRLFFDGYKVVRDDPGPDTWADTTTLYISVYDGEDDAAPLAGRGLLKIAPLDFLRQMQGTVAINTGSIVERLETQTKFIRFFMGELAHVYLGFGGGKDRPPRASFLDPDVPPRKLRPLRAPTPEVFPVRSDAGVGLRLTRFEGGTRGPVILAHDVGTWSRVFALDTVQPNLVEYLVAHKFDVWLLDWRDSVILPGARDASNADDVATQDWPAAIQEVLSRTAAASVQAVGHGAGGLTLLMSLLGGTEGVRAAVVIGASAHPAVTGDGARGGLFVPAALQTLQADSASAMLGVDRGGWIPLIDAAGATLGRDAADDCGSPACARISVLYGPQFSHTGLAPATHGALAELYGAPDPTLLDHLGLMAARGRLVSATGEDVYLPHLDRLGLPLTFVHGEEDVVFLPEGSATTVETLLQGNPAARVSRHLIPGNGHADVLIGEGAAKNVYPIVLQALEQE